MSYSSGGYGDRQPSRGGTTNSAAGRGPNSKTAMAYNLFAYAKDKFETSGASGLVYNFSEMEKQVREALNLDAWGPTGTQMSDIAKASYNYSDFSDIMGTIWSRLQESQWRYCYKAMLLLDYLLKNGSERCLESARENIYLLRQLDNFKFIDDEGKDQGLNVRTKAANMINFIRDDDKIREERDIAKRNRGKYGGVSNLDSGRDFRGYGNGGGGGMDRESSFSSGSASRYKDDYDRGINRNRYDDGNFERSNSYNSGGGGGVGTGSGSGSKGDVNYSSGSRCGGFSYDDDDDTTQRTGSKSPPRVTKTSKQKIQMRGGAISNRAKDDGGNKLNIRMNSVEKDSSSNTNNNTNNNISGRDNGYEDLLNLDTGSGNASDDFGAFDSGVGGSHVTGKLSGDNGALNMADPDSFGDFTSSTTHDDFGDFTSSGSASAKPASNTKNPLDLFDSMGLMPMSGGGVGSMNANMNMGIGMNNNNINMIGMGAMTSSSGATVGNKMAGGGLDDLFGVMGVMSLSGNKVTADVNGSGKPVVPAASTTVGRKPSLTFDGMDVGLDASSIHGGSVLSMSQQKQSQKAGSSVNVGPASYGTGLGMNNMGMGKSIGSMGNMTSGFSNNGNNYAGMGNGMPMNNNIGMGGNMNNNTGIGMGIGMGIGIGGNMNNNIGIGKGGNINNNVGMGMGMGMSMNNNAAMGSMNNNMGMGMGMNNTNVMGGSTGNVAMQPQKKRLPVNTNAFDDLF